MEHPTIGIDTAKDVFHVVLGDSAGRPVKKVQLKRNKLAAFMAKQAVSRVFLESCAGSHHWARKFTGQGHAVEQIAPQFVKRYRDGDKNDFNDGQACIEAGLRPTVRAVGTKSLEQQELQSLQRARTLALRQRNALGNQLRAMLLEFGVVVARSIAALRTLALRQRNALGNQLRAMLLEFGVVVARSIAALRQRIPEILEDGANELTDGMRRLVAEEFERWKGLAERVEELKGRLERAGRRDATMKRLQAELIGVGPLTAVGLWTAVADPKAFARGRQFAAYIGLVPRQYTTGGRARLLGIGKGGQCELRALLIHGARAAIRHLGDKTDPKSQWLRALVERRGKNRAAVALANKNARQAWAILCQVA
jgi:transposase